jgi:carboxypeptidase Q
VDVRKHWKLLTVAVVLLLVLSSAGFYALSGSKAGSTALVGFNPDEAYKDMEALCAIGPRVPGTEQDLEAAQYVQSRFTEAGLRDVRIEEYPVTTFKVNSASLSLIRLGLRTPVVKNYEHIKDFVLYEYSGSTSGDVRLEIVDVGNGTEEAFQGVDVTGKAVLTTMQCLPRAAEKGALAVIVQNVRLGEQYGFPPYNGGLYASDSSGNSIPYPDGYPDSVIPTCSVSKAIGDEIRDAIQNARRIPVFGSTVQIQLNFDVPIGKNKIYNVVGDVRGTKSPKEYVYFIAHRDSVYINPGACDDASGTVTIMELARQLAHCRPERTIRFISADAEEIGLLGATEYVKAHEDEVKKGGVLVLNFDMNDVNIERVKTLNVAIAHNYSKLLNETKSLMFEKRPDLKKYNIKVIVDSGGPDDAPFARRGVENGFAMGESGSSWEYHTSLDTIGYINKESWAVGGVLFGTLALRVAVGS